MVWPSGGGEQVLGVDHADRVIEIAVVLDQWQAGAPGAHRGFDHLVGRVGGGDVVDVGARLHHLTRAQVAEDQRGL